MTTKKKWLLTRSKHRVSTFSPQIIDIMHELRQTDTHKYAHLCILYGDHIWKAEYRLQRHQCSQWMTVNHWSKAEIKWTDGNEVKKRQEKLPCVATVWLRALLRRLKMEVLCVGLCKQSALSSCLAIQGIKGSWLWRAQISMFEVCSSPQVTCYAIAR